jgi:hypothetical protein
MELLMYGYAAIGLVVGCAATYKNRWIFRHGSFRVARAVGHTVIVGSLWWLLGPLALGLWRQKGTW